MNPQIGAAILTATATIAVAVITLAGRSCEAPAPAQVAGPQTSGAASPIVVGSSNVTIAYGVPSEFLTVWKGHLRQQGLREEEISRLVSMVAHDVTALRRELAKRAPTDQSSAAMAPLIAQGDFSGAIELLRHAASEKTTPAPRETGRVIQRDGKTQDVSSSDPATQKVTEVPVNIVFRRPQLPDAAADAGPASRHLTTNSQSSNATNVDCVLFCRGDGCSVNLNAERSLEISGLHLIHRCEHVRVLSGQVALRYFHKKRWFAPPALAKGQSAEQLFVQFPPDQPCAALSSGCLQAAMEAASSVVGGHGIGVSSRSPAGEGRPCELGLPCGSVLPNDTAQSIRLARPDLNGQLQLRLVRGTVQPGHSADVRLPIENGRVSLAAGTLQSGRAYDYTLLESGGRTVASGNVTVLSEIRVQGLRSRAQKRLEENTQEAAAWYDTLVDNELYWDAIRLARFEGPP